MERAARIMCWVAVGILGLAVGGQWLLTPEAAAEPFQITLGSAAALNQARGDIGGVFVGLAAVITLGLLRGEPRWLEAAAIALVGVIVGRLIGVAVDGARSEALTPIAVEIAMALALWKTARSFESAGSAGAAESAAASQGEPQGA